MKKKQKTKIRILVIGDFHGKFPAKLKKIARSCDLILSVGDFGGSKKLLNIVFKYFYKKWWKEVGKKKARQLVLEDYRSGKKIINELSKLGVPVYSVFGNWDFERTAAYKERTGGLKLKNYSKLMKKKKNIHFLKKRIIKLNGLKLYAFGGYVTPSIYLTKATGFNKKKRNKNRKQHKKEKKKLFSKASKDIDILLAHYTPYGYFDVVKFKGYNPMQGKHVGFKPYTEFIKKYHPKLFICGHMHEYHGIKKLGKTLIVNPGPAYEGRYAIIEIKGKKIKVKLKRVR